MFAGSNGVAEKEKGLNRKWLSPLFYW